MFMRTGLATPAVIALKRPIEQYVDIAFRHGLAPVLDTVILRSRCYSHNAGAPRIGHDAE